MEVRLMPVFRALALRSLRIWFLTRLLLAVLFALTGFEPFPVGTFSVGMIATSTFASWIDVRLHHAETLWGNLGLTGYHLAATSILSGTVGEMVLFAVL